MHSKRDILCQIRQIVGNLSNNNLLCCGGCWTPPNYELQEVFRKELYQLVASHAGWLDPDVVCAIHRNDLLTAANLACSLAEVYGDEPAGLRTSSGPFEFAGLPAQINVGHIGDKISYKNSMHIQGSTVNGSVTMSCEPMSSAIFDALDRIELLLQESDNADAVRAFHEIKTELEKPEPSKTQLRRFWGVLLQVAPTIAATRDIVATFSKFFQ